MESIAAPDFSVTPLLCDSAQAERLKRDALPLPSWDLSYQQLWDLELLLNGAFSPLRGYLTQAQYRTVCDDMRLPDGTVWPMPVTLDVSEAFAERISTGDRVALRHPEGMILAVLDVSSIWTPDREAEAGKVLGTDDESHPGVFQLRYQTGPVYLGGELRGVELPPHHTFQNYRFSPMELRAHFARLGWTRVVGFQTRRAMHRAQVEMTRRAAERSEANLLLHPVVGRTSPGDVDYFSRVRCYEVALEHYPKGLCALALLPLAMRLAGPREALWHSIVRRNYGCTHFIVAPHQSDPGYDANGSSFYERHAAQSLCKSKEPEIGIAIVAVDEMVYCEDRGEYLPEREVLPGSKLHRMPTTELARRLTAGADIPPWFSYPDVIAQLRLRYPARAQQGFTVFFTGLSGSGKSTVANILVPKLMEIDTRPVTLLDGDIVRKNLSSELGFSREHRDLNIRRIGFVASEITKNRGVAICAPIAPYRSTRRQVRELIGQYGGFIEVHMSTPLDVCEQRDRKGLYAKARAGLIKEFTGIDDPYEVPERPEVVLDTTNLTAEEAAQKVVLYLESEGYIGPRLES